MLSFIKVTDLAGQKHYINIKDIAHVFDNQKKNRVEISIGDYLIQTQASIDEVFAAIMCADADQKLNIINAIEEDDE